MERNRHQSEVTALARSIVAEGLIWDDHSGFEPHPAADLTKLELWRNAGVNYLSINVGFDVMPWPDTVKTLAVFRQWILNHSDKYILAPRIEIVRQAKREGKLAVNFDLEGMNALDGTLEMVGLFHALGVRQIGFAYNLNTLAGGGCHDQDTGLTEFGRQVVQEMNRLGILIDCSHAAHRTSLEAIELSADPVIFSHSNPRVLWDHERNIRDDQIRACAQKGGVIGVTGIGVFLGDNDIRTETIADHIDYLVRLVGSEHVGIGLDYAVEGAGGLDDIFAAHPEYWPPRQYGTKGGKFASPDQLRPLTEVLIRRGYNPADIHQILGQNFLRVAGQVWK